MKAQTGRGLLMAVAVAAVVAIGAHLPFFGRHAEAATGPGTNDPPSIAGCPIFPADNVWNTPIDQLPVDAHSAAYLTRIGTSKLHADFGSSPLSGIPYAVVPAETPRVRMQFTYHDDSDLSNYPIPPDAPIEGGAASKGDRHILLVDSARCLLWEVFAATRLPDGTWLAGSGIRIDLTGNALRPEGKTSADAAGLPILPGLARYDEVQTGSINHALRFTLPHTRNTYIWPARHYASKSSDPTLPPMGTRFRLRADFNISTFSPANQVILKALKRYGMLLADNGSAIYLSGVPDKRWSDDDLHKLGAVKTTDLEAVDESGLILLPASGRVDPVARKGLNRPHELESRRSQP